MDIKEKVAYLAGLLQAQGSEEGAAVTGAVLTGVLDVLAALAREVEALRKASGALSGRIRALDGSLADLADEVFGDFGHVPTTLIRCQACGQAMRVATADLEDDQVELVCPRCGTVVHAYDPGLDYDEGDDTLEGRTT
jgi:phage FluMu protein Com